MAVRLEDSAGGRMVNGRWVPTRAPVTRQNQARANQMVTSDARRSAQASRAAGAGYNYSAELAAARAAASGRLADTRAPAASRSTSTGSSGSRGRSYGGGGGGGGGGVNAAAQAQTSMDFITKLLASGMFTAPRQDALRNTITGATQNDLAAANTAWGNADAWLAQNQSNPYNDVRLQEAMVAPDQNAFLQSQGGIAQPVQTRNPNDGYGGFQNILALLAANQNVNNQSQRAGAQFGRADSLTGINAMDNAMLAGVTQRETDAQTALDAEKRQTLAQLIELIAQGAKAPDLASMGVYAPGGNAQDPHGWAAIDAAMRAAGQR